MVSSNASLSYASIIASAAPSQVLFFQLYKHANDEIAENRVREVEELGYKAIWLTVDAVVAGNRERDIKASWEIEEMEQEGMQARKSSSENTKDAEGVDFGGTAGAFVKYDDRDMTWKTVGRVISLLLMECSSCPPQDYTLVTQDHQIAHCH